MPVWYLLLGSLESNDTRHLNSRGAWDRREEGHEGHLRKAEGAAGRSGHRVSGHGERGGDQDTKASLHRRVAKKGTAMKI